MRRLCLALLPIAACAPSDPPLLIDETENRAVIALPGPPRVDGEGRVAIESVREMARAQGQLIYGAQCGEVRLPDRAFEPIEISGDNRPEYAVLLGRANCERDGGANRWLGTGGANVQIWSATGEPRMLLEHSMHGFSVGPRGMISLQHGGFCPGGSGPGMCLVQYEWNDRDRTLEVVHRQMYDDRHPGQPPRMSFDYETISR